ncbi:DISARM system helicase DrmA [Neobacillus sp. NPDC058068]|uniref:DISARM system helicase DrmA n=1 Tax=Neobacillus sp. NPDC058068 TaxID=3346325 RepID=UPI0036DAFCD5
MINDKVDVRKELLERLTTELVGPEYPEEIIKQKPLQRYLTGILWPINSHLANEENENNTSEGRDTNREEIETLAPLSKAMNPSAIGLSFLIDRHKPNVNVTVNLGMYEDLGDEKGDWKRKSFTLEKYEINFSKNLGKSSKQQIPKTPKAFLQWLARPYGEKIAVSIFLVNRDVQHPDDHEIDHKCVFQPEIIVEAIDGEKPFIERNAFSAGIEEYRDSDTESNDLLYRTESVFAVGHSISVNWDQVSKDTTRAGKLYTKVIPYYEIPMVIPPDWDKGGTLDMGKLAKMTSGKAIKGALLPLCNEYLKWINERKIEISHPNFEERYKQTAEKHMARCTEAYSRIIKGLEIICDDKTAFKSFIFMNSVMAKQRIQTVSAIEGVSPDNIKTEWRPFQIAFVLQNIEGTINPESSDRDIADLLWFPTGGGKTEAYLGLAAFTLGLRRMKKVQGLRTDVGVSVIMRYTLRLLTIQQFQRAAAMICACEFLRKKDTALLGNTPFRIGLWVGEKSVPNKYTDAADTIDALRKKNPVNPSKGSPVQLVTCPWCGHTLVDEDNPSIFRKAYKPNSVKRRLFISCPDKSCEFNMSNSLEGIPVVLTDEEIYRLLPDMIIGTVDKFARMPWKPETQNLFGKVKGEVPNWGFISYGSSKEENDNVKAVSGNLVISNTEQIHPPDLIIQDELHLISGPLGTMVGLYETAIDYLSSVNINEKKIGPKIVASTATIRNADQQIKGLFSRKAKIFPSPGLSHKDSFFAKQRNLKEHPGRIYVGIFAPGRSMKTAVLRTYANLLASTTTMEDKYTAISLDPYQTLVGYYNSLRELGGAVRLIEDDVPSRMKTLENISKEAEDPKFTYKKRDYDRDVPELTSRIDSSEIPKILKKLEQPFYKKGSTKPVDVLLASNMISVGVDVSRLGLMVVTGQPKTTAEFIQSTSRVGRSHPGLVLTVYNWIRPRDISHYEEFYGYHAALYRYVEPISVTPFASRARDRGLAGAMISMARLGFSDLTPNSAPGMYNEVSNLREDLQDILLERVRKMDGADIDVIADLKKLFDKWEEAIEQSKLQYNGRKKDDVNNLLYPLGQKESGKFKIPNSMRDVEAAAGIYIRRD